MAADMHSKVLVGRDPDPPRGGEKKGRKHSRRKTEGRGGERRMAGGGGPGDGETKLTFETPGRTFRTDPLALMTVPYISPSLTVRCTVAASSPSTLHKCERAVANPARDVSTDWCSKARKQCMERAVGRMRAGVRGEGGVPIKPESQSCCTGIPSSWRGTLASSSPGRKTAWCLARWTPKDLSRNQRRNRRRFERRKRMALRRMANGDRARAGSCRDQRTR